MIVMKGIRNQQQNGSNQILYWKVSLPLRLLSSKEKRYRREGATSNTLNGKIFVITEVFPELAHTSY